MASDAAGPGAPEPGVTGQPDRIEWLGHSTVVLVLAVLRMTGYV